jgi:hypothetical protein
LSFPAEPRTKSEARGREFGHLGSPDPRIVSQFR